MNRHFITFKPTTGVFQKAIKPYKKWYEKTDMSPPIEINGKHYRILRTTGMITKVNTRKMVICNEEGELIKDKKLTRECFTVFHYLSVFQKNSSSMIAGSKEDTVPKLNNFITEFKIILANTAPHLTKEEMEAMKFHLYYYEEARRFSEIITKEAIQLKSYIQPLRENQITKFSTSFIEKLKKHITEWEVNKEYVTALMIEDGLKARKMVRKILRNTNYQQYFPNRNITEQMIDEMNEADKAVNRLIHDGKMSWEREVKWLNSGKGKFNLETYLNDLRHRNVVEVFRKVNLNELITDHWVFSPSCLYL